MSYVRFNDQHDDGQLTQFRERLSAEVRVQTGEEFLIFQDRNDITWGQAWQQRIEQALDAVTLLLVIITPSFFRSPACRTEVERFLERERELGRQDLILPVYYVSTPELDDPELRDTDELARVLASRQYADWRELRFEPFTAQVVRKTLAQLAARMRETFWRQPSEVMGDSTENSAQEAKPDVDVAERTVVAKVSPKMEPPTHIVDAYRREGFATIAEAVKVAQPGDRILVRPGLYREGLVIDKPLEILGDGPVADIEIQARDDDAIVFRANIGRVANLTVRQIGGEEFNAIDITQGRLELEGCDISCEGDACVLIRGGADPRLRRNRIHDGAREGVFVQEEGLGTLEDNDIFNNREDGVGIIAGSNPTLRRNQIHDNKHNGVFVARRGLGTLEDNEISRNAHAGVTVTTGGNPTLRNNQIHDNAQYGVLVYGRTRGTLEDNQISGNSYSGVHIQGNGSNPTLRHNYIHDNKLAGVVVYGRTRGTLEDNQISGNTLSGLQVKEGGNPTLRRNQINDNKQNGVSVSDRGLGMLENNQITDNLFFGVMSTSDGNPTLRRNRIQRNSKGGVNITNNGGGVLEDNDLRGNNGVNLNIADGSKEKVISSGNRE